MNLQQRSRKEYLQRINRVVDYIDGHLDQEHTLDQLSAIACFSPFHFHRIFKALTGETINNYVRRIRLQRAGSMLLNDYERPVAEVASLCGFNSTAVFCRAFREHFGTSTGNFRKIHQANERKDDQQDRRIDQSRPDRSLYISDEIINQNRNPRMEQNIQIKEMPAMELVYCRHTGPFDQIGHSYEKLFKWAGPRGLLKFPETKTVTVYHDDPKVVDLENLRQSACITVREPVRAEGEFGNMHLPGSRCAVGSYRIKPHQFTEAWDEVCRWLADSGYQPSDGYPFEYYPEDHSDENPPTFTLVIFVPVMPL
jgi:AraC family transcriptional regulator